MKKLNVVFFGTPDFSVPTLDILNNHPHVNLKYVISMPDRPAGRGQKLKSPEVIEYAAQNKIKYFQTKNINKETDFIKDLENESIDIFIVLAFAQFLGSKVLALPSKGCFNIHTSLLPSYRGAAPIQYALLNGDMETGVSIQKMVKKMDAGDLVANHKVSISATETGGQLYSKLKYQAALTTDSFIYDILDNKLNPVPQDEEMVTFAPTLSKEDGHLHFKTETFDTINNKVRALKPWPGTFCLFNNKRLKVIEIEEYPTKQLKPGDIQLIDKKLLVGSADKTIRLSYIQIEGKKACSDIQLSNGLHNSKDTLTIS